jgi:small subunit ribosomal protein S6
MRAYECTYILSPTLEESAVAEKSERFSEIVTSRKGTVHNIDRWGKRKLAYSINKFQEGIYTLMRFSGDNDILKELNRVFRFDDDVIRYLIVVDENPAPVEKMDQTESVPKE